MVDLLGIKESSRLIELQKMGVDLVSLHYGKDMQLEGEMGDNLFSLTEGMSGIEIAVAGGINKQLLASFKGKSFDTVIIGSAITGAENPGQAANDMKEVMNQHEIDH